MVSREWASVGLIIQGENCCELPVLRVCVCHVLHGVHRSDNLRFACKRGGICICWWYEGWSWDTNVSLPWGGLSERCD
jgi:hypothetical protein